MWTNTVLTFVVLGVGFVVARVLVEGLRRWGLLHGGAVFCALGFLAGPRGIGVVDPAGLAELAPILGILVGWVGLQAGLGASARRDGGLVEGALRAGLFYVFIVLLGVGAIAAALLVLQTPRGLRPEDVALTAAVIASASVAGAPQAVHRIARRFGAAGNVYEAGESLTRLARAAGLLAFTITLAFYIRPTLEGLRPLAPTEWLLAEVAVGAVLGVAADYFLGEEPDDSRLFMTLAAVSILGTGLSWHLRLSPILINLVIGLTLANVGYRQARRHAAVTSFETPTLYLLLLYAGAAWTPTADPMAWGLLAAVIGARTVAAALGGAVAGRALAPSDQGLRRLGFTALGQGAPAVAVAVAWSLVAPEPTGQLVLLVVVGTTLVNDLWAGTAARIVLDEAGEIPARRPEEPEEPEEPEAAEA